MGHKVLVVGTTPDYVEWIKTLLKGEVFFITDLELRKSAIESNPTPTEEILCNLADYKNTVSFLKEHVKRYDIEVVGITCFDCESMELASAISKELNLKFQALCAIHNCRDKFMSKAHWKEKHLFTPDIARIKDFKQAEVFFKNLKGQGCVLKPSSGAGSELVFLCHDLAELKLSYEKASEGLKEKTGNRLYNSPLVKSSLILEEYIAGTEYSCDFIIKDDSVKIIRLTEKLKFPGQIFGIIDGYKLINFLPGISEKNLHDTLYKAASSIGLNNTICMLDFIVRDNHIYLIEIAPRPGGDCLPQLLELATGQNILVINIDLARGKMPQLLDYKTIKPWIALRIFANREGTLLEIETKKLLENPMVAKVNITSYVGKKIEPPPKDYDSWVLGNIILKPDVFNDIYHIAKKIIGSVNIEISPQTIRKNNFALL